jgi:predicted GNAT family acetyltransferase
VVTLQEMTMLETEQSAHGAHPLDKVVWNALASKQQHLALGDERVLRYPSDIARFAGMADSAPESFDVLRTMIEVDGPLALVTTAPVEAPSWSTVVRRGELLQMIWQGAPGAQPELPHVALGSDDVPDMLALTAATEPGPFGPRTIELGNYIGIRSEGKLAAMAGERMRLDGFTEISAVCVDPAFRGRGYAGGLMKLLISSINARDEVPFLHVFTSNHGAIALYRTLGFVDRRQMHLLVLGAAN